MRRWLLWALSPLLLLLLSACARATSIAPPTVEPVSVTSLPTLAATPSLVPTASPEVASPTPSPRPTPTIAPATATSPSLPAVPAGMQVAPISPPRYAVRLSAPALKIRSGPNAQSSVVGVLECGAAPVVIDAVAEGADVPWYHLGAGGWVRSDVVEVYADEVAAQTAARKAACAVADNGGSGGETEGGDYILAAAAVWNLGDVAPPDNRSGECLSETNYVPPYGPASFTYDGRTLTVRTQEPGSAYVLTRIAPNVYAYSGPTAMGDGRVTLTLKFTSALTASLTRVFVPNEDSACRHTYYYSVTHMWDR